MLSYLVRRLAAMIPLLFVVSIVIFALVRLTPTDPIAALTKGRRVNEQTRKALIHEFYLDRSLAAQYFIWAGKFVRGDLSMSFQQRQPVQTLLKSRLPTTAQLILMSAVEALVLSLAIGIACALKKNTALDRVLSALMIAAASAPPFLLAIVLMLVFALGLRWFPTFGAGHGFFENLHYLALPSVALSLNMIALTGRITRSQLIEELGANYAVTETAKGTPPSRIVLRHCLKNALIPVITIGGMQAGGMITGAVLVENVFALGGVGSLLVEAIKAADYPVVQSLTLLLVLVFLLINLGVDTLYALIDPRIRSARNWTRRGRRA